MSIATPSYNLVEKVAGTMLLADDKILLRFWTNVETIWSRILEWQPVKDVMAERSWDPITKTDHHKLKRQLLSAEAKAITIELVLRRTFGEPIGSYTALTARVGSYLP